MKKLNKYVYYFGSKLVEGGKEDKEKQEEYNKVY